MCLNVGVTTTGDAVGATTGVVAVNVGAEVACVIGVNVGAGDGAADVGAAGGAGLDRSAGVDDAFDRCGAEIASTVTADTAGSEDICVEISCFNGFVSPVELAIEVMRASTASTCATSEGGMLMVYMVLTFTTANRRCIELLTSTLSRLRATSSMICTFTIEGSTSNARAPAVCMASMKATSATRSTTVA